MIYFVGDEYYVLAAFSTRSEAIALKRNCESNGEVAHIYALTPNDLELGSEYIHERSVAENCGLIE
jgi:hypothetical protein